MGQLTKSNTTHEIVLIDARQAPQECEAAAKLGLDINQGIIVKDGDKTFHGEIALGYINNVSTRTGTFNRINQLLFGSSTRAKTFYPLLRGLRNVLLWILRIESIGVDSNHKTNGD